MRFLLLPSAVALAAAPAMSTDQQRPIHLEVVGGADSVDLIVTGDAGAEADARFTLEVASEGTGGTTKTAQSGTNRKSGAGGTLLRSHIRTSGLKGWNARLHVVVDGREYVEIRKSDG